MKNVEWRIKNAGLRPLFCYSTSDSPQFVLRGVLETRNSNNPILSNVVAQYGVEMRGGSLRARGTLLLKLLIVACFQHAIGEPHPPYPTLRSTSLRLCGVIKISCLWHAKSMFLIFKTCPLTTMRPHNNFQYTNKNPVAVLFFSSKKILLWNRHGLCIPRRRIFAKGRK